MNCRKVMELMQRYLDRDLDQDEFETMQRHFPACPECSDMFERLKRLSEDLEKLPKVTPPFSLVDSILPQLEEIDRMRSGIPVRDAGEKTGGTKKQEVEGDIGKTGLLRRLREKIPLAALSGVVAAGIVLGLFIAGTGIMQDQTADDLLMGHSAGSKSAENAKSDHKPAGNESSADVQALSGGRVDMSSANTPSVSTPSANEPAEMKPKQPQESASAQSGGGGKPNEMAAATKDQYGPAVNKHEREARNAVPDRDPAPVGISSSQAEPPEATASAPEPAPEPASAPAPAAIERVPTRPEAVASAPAGEAKPANEPSAAGSAREEHKDPAEAVGSKALQTAPEREPEVQFQAQMAVPDGRAPTLNSAEPQPNQGFAANAVHGLASPDGKFTAVVEKQKVVIKKNDENVFVSANQWKETDRITLVNWTSGTQLVYEVRSDGGSQQFVIDVEKKTEMKK